MENTVFLVDLPKRISCADEEFKNEEIPFQQSLSYFLRAMELQEDVTKKMCSFDYSKLKHHGFIHTIGGSHHGEAWKKNGVCGLGAYLQNLGLDTCDPVEVDFVTSSLGSLNDEFLRSLYLAAQGDCGLAEYSLRSIKSLPASTLNDIEGRLGKDVMFRWKQHFRFYFPSETTVKSSRGGPAYGGTICFNSRWWDGPKFPRSLMRDCQSQREGILMHNKVILPNPLLFVAD